MKLYEAILEKHISIFITSEIYRQYPCFGRFYDDEKAPKFLKSVLPMKMKEIHDFVMKESFHPIIELGSGYSTCVWDYSRSKLKKMNPRHEFDFITIDENEKYQDSIITNVIEGNLENRCNFQRKVLRTEESGKYICFKGLSQELKDISDDYMFLYVDAPDNSKNDAICTDVIELWDNGIYPKKIAFDVRISSFLFAIKNDRKDFYNIKPGFFVDPGATHYHNILERKF